MCSEFEVELTLTQPSQGAGQVPRPLYDAALVRGLQRPGLGGLDHSPSRVRHWLLCRGLCERGVPSPLQLQPRGGRYRQVSMSSVNRAEREGYRL